MASTKSTINEPIKVGVVVENKILITKIIGIIRNLEVFGEIVISRENNEDELID